MFIHRQIDAPLAVCFVLDTARSGYAGASILTSSPLWIVPPLATVA